MTIGIFSTGVGCKTSSDRDVGSKMTTYHSQAIPSDVMNVLMSWVREESTVAGVYQADVVTRDEFGGNSVRLRSCENRDAALHMLLEEYYESEGWPACNDLVGGAEMSEGTSEYVVTRIYLRLSGSGASLLAEQAEPLVQEINGRVKVLSPDLRELRA